ncbi:hypothetical protein [Bacillus sp. FJAT-29814]|uniref:hypothetical protein n=1 Tax=Bacillus sp. FJAT-29814 TaxID=1729688 RepID=UPI000835632C|nr:hypothetical protein [Bacillus sp. FJAT-29814]
MIMHFYLSPYIEDIDYDYDSWHGFSRNVFLNTYEQQLQPSTRLKNGSKVQYYQVSFVTQSK